MYSHFSTLGYSPNPLLETYQQRFIKKLEQLWKTQIGDTLPDEEFLLSPDIHSLLLSDASKISAENKEIIIKEFENRNKNNGILYIEESDYIPGTSIKLTSVFHNPDALYDAHPDHQSNGVGVTFGEQDEQSWKILFAESFAIIRKVSPGFMNEISHILKKIIPLGVSQKVHNSGSYSNAIGQIFMSYPADIDHPEYSILEALLHEYNHNKLNLILQTETLVLNDWQENYYSPYRPDARHIHGVYLGLHALTGAYWVIWNAHREGILHLPINWLEKATLYVLKNGLALQVLDTHARLSSVGEEIMEEMRRVHQECLQFIRQSNLPPDVLKRAKEELMMHYDNVRKRHPHILS